MSTPNTSVWVCRGVKTDKTYNHVLLFGSASARFNYFTSKAVRSFDNYTYQRTERYLTVGVNSEVIEECNYLVFINRTFSDKVYYAFIDKIEYLSDKTSRIYFTIDVMQTWFPDCTLHPCYIDRQHSSTDAIGDNIVADDLDCGDYIDTSVGGLRIKTKIAFLCTFDSNYNDAAGKMVRGLYSGLVETSFDNASDATNFIEGAVEAGKADGIIACYMSPGETNNSYNLKRTSSVNGYTPKNNKLFTYPYCYHRISDNSGSINVVLKDEFFEGTPSINVVTTGGQGSPELGVVPVGYKNGTTNVYNWNEAIYSRPFPNCAYNTDIYKAYMAQNASSVFVQDVGNGFRAGMSIFNGTMGIVGGAAMLSNPATFAAGASQIGNAVSNIGNEALSVAQINAKREDMDRLPPQSNGTPSVTLAFMQALGVTMQFYYHTVTSQYAKIIDDYWTVYGYPYHSVQTPNITSRSQWNYIRCGNSCITGPVPADALRLINDIFNRGVTFWHNPENVGRYELANNIV